MTKKTIKNKPVKNEKRITTGEYIGKYKSIYKTLKPTYPPAIGDKIYFNMAGFKHLVFKNSHRRQTKAILNRLVLIPLIVPVILNCDEETEIRIHKENIRGEKAKVTYYTLGAHVGKNSAHIKVVTRKIGQRGHYYFQSIMKYQKNTSIRK